MRDSLSPSCLTSLLAPSLSAGPTDQVTDPLTPHYGCQGHFFLPIYLHITSHASLHLFSTPPPKIDTYHPTLSAKGWTASLPPPFFCLPSSLPRHRRGKDGVPRVGPRDQLLVRALLHNAAVEDHADEVGVADGGEAVVGACVLGVGYGRIFRPLSLTTYIPSLPNRDNVCTHSQICAYRCATTMVVRFFAAMSLSRAACTVASDSESSAVVRSGHMLGYRLGNGRIDGSIRLSRNRNTQHVPEVASSRRRMAGSFRMARAMAMRCVCCIMYT